MNQEQEHFLSQLFDQQFIALYKYLYHHTRDKELAYDLAQEAFARLCTKIDNIGHSNLVGWLYVTANYLVKNQQKRKDNQIGYLDDYLDIPSHPQESALWELLPSAHLSEDERQLLIWRFQDDLSYEAISSRLNISVAACRNRVYRALNKCRGSLKKEDLF